MILISKLLMMILVLSTPFSRVNGEKIPLSCYDNAKQRFTIGNKGVWGPKLWHSLHCTALNYPQNPSESDKENYKSFYENVHRIIPCRLCANHYKQNVINFDLDQYTDSPRDLFKFTVDIHNLVNSQLNKEIWKFDDALKLYQQTCKKCEQTPHDLEQLINDLKPEEIDYASDSVLSIAISGAVYRIGFFALGIIAVALVLFVWNKLCNKNDNKKKD